MARHANMTAPQFTVIVRKAYGLGAQAMCGAGILVGFFAVAWPTAEFAGMNIDGAVKLGYRKELMAIEDAGRGSPSSSAGPRSTPTSIHGERFARPSA